MGHKKVVTKKTKAKVKKPKAARVKKTPEEKKAALRAKVAAEAESIAKDGPNSPHYVQWLKNRVLRRAFKKWPTYYLTWEKAECRMIKAPDRRGVLRLMKHYQCAWCKKWFIKRDLNLDHKVEVGSVEKVTALYLGNMLINMYCTEDNIQLLCDYTLDDAEKRFNGVKSCHYRKGVMYREANKE